MKVPDEDSRRVVVINSHMYYNLNSLKGDYIGDHYRAY